MYRRSSREKRLMVILAFIVFGVLGESWGQSASASETLTLYFFWGEGCPHCEEEKEFLKILREDFPQLEMCWFEVWNHPEFAKLADDLRKAYDIKVTSVPMTFLGEWGHVGFHSFERTGVEMARQVEACLQQGCSDPLEKIGPQRITARIRDEMARNDPKDWEYYPALATNRKNTKK